MAIQKSRERYKIQMLRESDGAIMVDRVDTSSYGGAWAGQLPIPKAIGEIETYVIHVQYLGEHQFRTPYEKRVAAHKRNEEAAKKRKQEMDEKSLVMRRKRIMNQIELAFEKKGKDAVKFVTCDECDDVATHLGLAYDNLGSRSIAPEQITGAWCGIHSGDGKHFYGKFQTTALIECSVLEFFYDGLKQIYINRPK